MEFHSPKGIFLQIADQMCRRILRGDWSAGERIPSIRELAVEIGVNPNTVTKTYQALVDEALIENRRGLGFFVTEQAADRIVEKLRAEFIEQELPRIRRTMQLLQLDAAQLVQMLEQPAGE